MVSSAQSLAPHNITPCEEDSEVTETRLSSETVDSEGESGTAGVGAGTDGTGFR